MNALTPHAWATGRQLSFAEMDPVQAAVAAMAEASMEARGAVFTRREVVDFILDVAGYHKDKPLHEMRLLEPSFGHGDFLLPATERLLSAWSRSGADAIVLTRAVQAVELNPASVETTRAKLLKQLDAAGVGTADAGVIVDAWLIQDDFLLTELETGFDFVVGNPPYVRQEMIPGVLIAEYRARYATIYDRADIYVPFIERSLTLLRRGGRCGFICSDRWMKNRYGGPLRGLVASGFHLETYVDMVGTDAFTSDVVAYPAITVISAEKPGSTRIAHRPAVAADTLAAVAHALTADDAANDVGVREIAQVTLGSEPWILESSDQLALVRRLEATFPLIEKAGCSVGIGVATGADQAFIGKFDELDVEDSRKLPLVMTKDIMKGHVHWRGYGVVNPFADEGGLVDLNAYPRLRAYLETRRDQIERRHVAQKSPERWYRTIDRIYPALAAQPKLLVPDIKGAAHIVYEDEGLYPHHNLYFITSDSWDLRALQAVLMSGIARMFVAIYSTKMRGGYLRFQAQYLRRIRLPAWTDVSPGLQQALIAAAAAGDVDRCNVAVFELYQLTADERAALGGSSL